MPYFIHIEWEGPRSFEEVKNDDCGEGCGLYAVYGATVLYGGGKLLYIGKAAGGSFRERLKNHDKMWGNWNADSGRMQVYLGSLLRNKPPNTGTLEAAIDKAERLLIYAHAPARNSSLISKGPSEELSDVHVLNWGQYRDLMPEVSGARWTSKFNDISEKWIRPL